MVSYDEEDEDSDIFGESDRDDDEDNTGVCPHFTDCLLAWNRCDIEFISLIQNTGPSSFAEELAARIKGDAVIKAEGDRACKCADIVDKHPFSSHVECHPYMCMLMIFVFLPCPAWEALASKKKSKGRKESKASKLQGMNFNYHRRHWAVISFAFICCIVVYCCTTYCCWSTAEDDDDDMFKPPEMDDDDFSPFGGKGGLFSGGRGLFDDDDEVSFCLNWTFMQRLFGRQSLICIFSC